MNIHPLNYYTLIYNPHSRRCYETMGTGSSLATCPDFPLGVFLIPFCPLDVAEVEVVVEEFPFGLESCDDEVGELTSTVVVESLRRLAGW